MNAHQRRRRFRQPDSQKFWEEANTSLEGVVLSDKTRQELKDLVKKGRRPYLGFLLPSHQGFSDPVVNLPLTDMTNVY